MVGKKESIEPMWAKIRKYIELDPETPLVDHVYLGCTQREVEPNREIIEAKQQLFAQLMSKKGSVPKEGVTKQPKSARRETRQVCWIAPMCILQF